MIWGLTCHQLLTFSLADVSLLSSYLKKQYLYASVRTVVHLWQLLHSYFCGTLGFLALLSLVWQILLDRK